jgi:hypothetical protein
MELPPLARVLSTAQFLFASASLLQLLLGVFLYPRLAWGVAKEILARRGRKDPRTALRNFFERPPAAAALADYSLFVVRASMILRSQVLALLSAGATFVLLLRDAQSIPYFAFCAASTLVAATVAILSFFVFLWRLYRDAYDPLAGHAGIGVYLSVVLANSILLVVGIVAAC